MRHFVPVSAESPDSGSAYHQNAAKRRRERACARIPRSSATRVTGCRRSGARSPRACCWRHTAKLTPVCARNCRVNVRRLNPRPRPPGRDRPRSTATQAGAGTPSPAVRRPAAARQARHRRDFRDQQRHQLARAPVDVVQAGKSIASSISCRSSADTPYTALFGQARLLRGGAGHERVEHRDRPGHRHFVPHAGRHPARALRRASVRAASTR